MPKYTCLNCHRHNFRTQGGLNQHLKNHHICSQVQKIRALKVGKTSSKVSQAVPPKRNKGRAKNASNSFAKATNNFPQLPTQRSQIGHQFAASSKKAPPASLYALQEYSDAASEDDNVLYSDDDTLSNFDSDEDEEEEEMHLPVNRESIRNFKDYVKKARQHLLKLNKFEVGAVKLMDVLHRKKACLDTYDAVMEWHFKQTGLLKEHQSLGYAIDYLSRKSFIPTLASRYNIDPKNLLQSREEVLPRSRTKVKIVWHHARDCVVSLLTDPRLQDEDYLFFDNDPLAPPPDHFDYVCDVNSGTSYTETYKRLITKPGKQILVPIIMYIDGAVTGQFSKLEVTALTFTLGIFHRKARDKHFLWRSLGYVPNFSKETSRGNKMFRDSGHIAASNLYVSDGEGEQKDTEEHNKAQDLHSILSYLLESYRELEAESMLWDLNYRGKLYKDVELVFYLAFVKCDNDEADKLCGQYRVRNGKVACICRYCICPTRHSDDQHAKYPYKTEAKITRLVEAGNEEALKKISQHGLVNAFHGLRFGFQNKRGIHGACPMELLHTLQLGIFKRVRECFFTQIGDTSILGEEINSLAKLYGRLFNRQSDRDLPQTNFAKGIKKGKITAKEFSGVMLLMAAILQSFKGRAMLSTQKKNFGELYLLDDWVMLVETMLEWEAFLKLDRMEMKHVKRLERKHKYVMYLLKKIANRTTGMGFCIIKFHGILHMIEDMLMFGVPMVVDTGSNEGGHKETKTAAQLTQKNPDTFETQTETRLVEFRLVELAMLELGGDALWEYFDELILPVYPEFGQIEDDNGPVEEVGPRKENNIPTKEKKLEPGLKSLPMVQRWGLSGMMKGTILCSSLWALG